MLAVGVSIPLSYGRLGKGWRHACGLQQLVQYDGEGLLSVQMTADCFNRRKYLSTSDSADMLEQYWEKHKIDGADAGAYQEPDSPAIEWTRKHTAQVDGYRRNRAVSGATAVMTQGQPFSPHHPALSLPKLIDEFGPLIFPLYRAALLRKRILLLSKPPVEQNCNFGTIKSTHTSVSKITDLA
jgi:DENN domain-containing protein 11